MTIGSVTPASFATAIRPETRRVHDNRCIDALASRGLHAGDAVTRRAERHHLDALLDADAALAAPPRRSRSSRRSVA